MDSTSKNEEDAAADFGLNRMMLEDVDIEEPEEEKAGSGKPKTMEATGVIKDGQVVQAAMEVGVGKEEDQSGTVNKFFKSENQ